jgi:hypothetical protein
MWSLAKEYSNRVFRQINPGLIIFWPLETLCFLAGELKENFIAYFEDAEGLTPQHGTDAPDWFFEDAPEDETK